MESGPLLTYPSVSGSQLDGSTVTRRSVIVVCLTCALRVGSLFEPTAFPALVMLHRSAVLSLLLRARGALVRDHELRGIPDVSPTYFDPCVCVCHDLPSLVGSFFLQSL